MSLLGTLAVDLACRDGRVEAVHFSGLTPVPLDRLLAGRAPDEAAAIIPSLFPLCGNAQAAAAAAALEAAMAFTPDEGEIRARAALVTAEAMREHAGRVVVDWPAFVESEPDSGTFAALHRAVRDLRLALYGGSPVGQPARLAARDGADAAPAVTAMLDALARGLFGDGPGTLDTLRDAEGLRAWAREGRTAPARLLTRLLDDPGDGAPPAAEDDTPFGRHRDDPAVSALRRGHGDLAARLAARLAEIAVLASALERFVAGGAPASIVASGSAAPHSGWARVSVARGTLAHDVTISAGRVADYRIAAPTTDHFAPGHAAERALKALRGRDCAEIAWRARLTVMEFDPCVAHEVRVV